MNENILLHHKLNYSNIKEVLELEVHLLLHNAQMLKYSRVEKV